MHRLTCTLSWTYGLGKRQPGSRNEVRTSVMGCLLQLIESDSVTFFYAINSLFGTVLNLSARKADETAVILDCWQTALCSFSTLRD